MYAKKFIKYPQRGCSLLWTLLLISQFFEIGVSSTPTKHLKVTAEGDTPKLIVTSEEDFGTEPKRLVAAKSKYHRTATTILPLATNPSSTTTTLEQLLATEENLKNKRYETEIPNPTTTTTSIPIIKTSTTEVTNILTTTTTISELLFNNNDAVKDTATTTKIATTASDDKNALGVTTTTAPFIDKHTILKHDSIKNQTAHNKKFTDITNTTSNILQQSETTTISLLEAEPTTLKRMVQSVQNVKEKAKKFSGDGNQIAIVSSLATTTTTTAASLSETEKLATKENGQQQQQFNTQTQSTDTLVPPAAEHELLTIKARKTYNASTMELPTTTNTLVPVKSTATFSVIDKLNDKMMISHSEAPEQTPKMLNADKGVYRINSSDVAIVSTNVIKGVTIPTTSVTLPQLTTRYTEAQSSEHTGNVLSTTSGTQMPVMVTTHAITLNMDVMLNDQQQEEVGVLKLLDLEKQESKSQQRQRKEKLLKQKHQSQADVVSDDFDGHDGIKKTKKKQLQIDKNILADIGMSISSTPTTPVYTQSAKSNLELIVEKTASKVKKSDNNVRTKLLLDTTNSNTHSLGPIHMDEKVYSVKEKLPTTLNEAQKVQHNEKFNINAAREPHITMPRAFPKNMLKLSTRTQSSTPATKNYLTEQTESKISDIQVEIYDSTIDSLVASASLIDDKAGQLEHLIDFPSSTMKSPPPVMPQERFTQYVIDRDESSTQESNLLPSIPGTFGKPEPAAIEIHINVSEGIGNGSEDLEFSYPQASFESNEPPVKLFNKESVKFSGSKISKLNDTKNASDTDEILVVEIIDTGDNCTDNSISGENIHPVFTFRTDQSVNEIEFKDVAKENRKTSKAQQADELFMADIKHFSKIPAVTAIPPLVRQSAIDRDSDTIFYISNTEVKVGESIPTSIIESDSYKIKQKSQINSAYMLSTYPNLHKSSSRRYEEDILLSPLQNTADSLKIFRNQNEADAPPLDVTYVGESVMEVEQLSPGEKEANDIIASSQILTTTSTLAPGHVIIQPATLSEIGVPVIGELPPQIELKEFDFMPDELTNHEQGTDGVSGAEEESGHMEDEQTLVGNDVERLVESSIQYGGDLIDEGAVDNGGGFDGAEGSYPFGNLATMGRHGRQNSKRKHGAHFNIHHGVNNLRKDELSVDVGVEGAAFVDDGSSIQLNNTFKDTEAGMHNVSDTSMNITFSIAERMMNATPASVIEDPKRQSLNVNEEYYWSMGFFGIIFTIAFIPGLMCISLFW